MTGVRELHERAMEYADLALISRMNGDEIKAKEQFNLALKLEAEAAFTFKDRNVEPTRSVLFRSAASLAFQGGAIREAEQLAAYGLAGNPPNEIANELRELLDKINFNRHLDLKGIFLGSNEFQFSIAGRAIDAGIAPSDAVIERLEKIKAIIYRTFERLFGKGDYRSGGISPFTKLYPSYVTVPRERSFAMTIKIAHPDQPPLPGMENYDMPSQVVQEVLDCIEILDQKGEERLRQRIVTPAYYNNFISLINKIAPDGDDISTVGFTTMVNGKERRVALARSQEEISDIPMLLTENIIDRIKGERVQVNGRLLFADALKQVNTGVIKLRKDDGKILQIIVPEGMDDIVGPLWSQRVTVTGTKSKNKLLMENITRSDD